VLLFLKHGVVIRSCAVIILVS